MSQYASLVCNRCRVRMFLGKAVYRIDVSGSDQINHFWRADAIPTNARDAVLSRALWKILADHGRHGLHVLVEGTKAYETTHDYTEIGGDQFTDIPFERYLAGWDG